MADLTPYDTGARAKPKVWKTKGDPDRYGKVDFKDAESATVATICLMWDSDEERYIVHIAPHQDISICIEYDTVTPVPLPDLTEEKDE